MAVLGITKLIAVNRMLRSINTLKVPALDTGGASIEAFAEDVLDEVTTQVLVRGGDEVVTPGIVLTPSAGTITVSSDTLAVFPAGKDKFRPLTLRGDALWDVSLNANAGSSGNPVTVDVVYLITFVNCPPKIKEAICNEACQVFQRRYKGSMQADGWLSEEFARTQIASGRPTAPGHAGPALNPVPVTLAPPPQQ